MTILKNIKKILKEDEFGLPTKINRPNTDEKSKLLDRIISQLTDYYQDNTDLAVDELMKYKRDHFSKLDVEDIKREFDYLLGDEEATDDSEIDDIITKLEATKGGMFRLHKPDEWKKLLVKIKRQISPDGWEIVKRFTLGSQGLNRYTFLQNVLSGINGRPLTTSQLVSYSNRSLLRLFATGDITQKGR